MSANNSNDKGSRAGSFLWFLEKVLPHFLSSLLTVVGLISAWFLFGAGEVSKIWENQRQQDLAAFENTLQTQREKEMEIFKNQLNQPNLEYELILSANPLIQSAPEVITESIKIENTGTDAAMNVKIRAEFRISIYGETKVTPTSEGMSVQVLEPSSVEITFSKLQVKDYVLISIPLKRQDILNLGTTPQEFLTSQNYIVTCDGNCNSAKTGVSVPPQGTYVVQSGDSLPDIANKFDLNTSDLESANPYLNNYNFIYPGQVLVVP